MRPPRAYRTAQSRLVFRLPRARLLLQAARAALQPATPTAAPAQASKLKIGLVTDVGRLNDKSFNQTSWEGVQQAGSDLGDEIKAIETTDTKDYDKNIQQFVCRQLRCNRHSRLQHG